MELNYLKHHGTKGMKWDVRRYQYKDGSLTPAGKKRYSNSGSSSKRNDREFYEAHYQESTGSYTTGKAKRETWKEKNERKRKEEWDASHEDYKRAHTKKKISEMSDEELQERATRLSREKKVSELTPKEKTTLEKSGDIVDGTKSLVDSAKRLNSAIPMKAKRAKTLDLSNMSDQEMRAQINRELLERQYNDVFNPPKVSKGREVVSTILEIGGGVLAAGSSAIAIAAGIQALRKGG